MKKVVVEFMLDSEEHADEVISRVKFPPELKLRAIHSFEEEPVVIKAYNGPAATDDSKDHIESIVDRVPWRRIEALAKTIVHKETFQVARSNEDVTQVVTSIARSALGYNRPWHENDAEYYALCDALFNKAIRFVHIGFYKGMQS